MLHALETEDALSVKSEKIRGVLERWQIDIHQDAEVETQQGEVVIVIGLKIPEGDLSQFIAMNSNECRWERIHFTKCG